MIALPAFIASGHPTHLPCLQKGQALAPKLYKLFPWLKIVIMLREPISRAISYTRMHTQLKHPTKGCSDGESLYECLLRVIGEPSNALDCSANCCLRGHGMLAMSLTSAAMLHRPWTLSADVPCSPQGMAHHLSSKSSPRDEL